MTEIELDESFVWTLILVLGIGVFALRLSFIQLYAWVEEFPPTVEQALGFIPAAILAALVFPALVTLEGILAGTFLTPRLVAGGVATLVAWRTNSFMAPILVGMGVLWAGLYLVG